MTSADPFSRMSLRRCCRALDDPGVANAVNGFAIRTAQFRSQDAWPGLLRPWDVEHNVRRAQRFDARVPFRFDERAAGLRVNKTRERNGNPVAIAGAQFQFVQQAQPRGLHLGQTGREADFGSGWQEG